MWWQKEEPCHCQELKPTVPSVASHFTDWDILYMNITIVLYILLSHCRLWNFCGFVTGMADVLSCYNLPHLCICNGSANSKAKNWCQHEAHCVPVLGPLWCCSYIPLDSHHGRLGKYCSAGESYCFITVILSNVQIWSRKILGLSSFVCYWFENCNSQFLISKLLI